MPRWPEGSTKRLAHGALLVFLQPLVPVAAWVVQRDRLFDEAGTFLEPPPLAFLLAALQGGLAIAVLVGALLCLPARMSLRELGWARLSPQGAILGVAGGIATVAATLALLAAFGTNVRDLVGQMRSASFGQRAFAALVAIQIAFFEETVFRGYVQPSASKRFGRWAGVIAVALLYAAWHPPHFDLRSFVTRLAQGLLYGLLRDRTGTLAAPAVAHALFWTTFGFV